MFDGKGPREKITIGSVFIYALLITVSIISMAFIGALIW